MSRKKIVIVSPAVSKSPKRTFFDGRLLDRSVTWRRVFPNENGRRKTRLTVILYISVFIDPKAVPIMKIT